MNKKAKNILTTVLGTFLILIAVYFFYENDSKTWPDFLQMIGLILVGYAFIQAWNKQLKAIQGKIFGVKNNKPIKNRFTKK